MEKYDYIICGAGCAGLTLAYLLNQSELKSKKTLVLDVKKKNRNDRTFCFWEKGKNIFEEIVYHRWNNLSVKSNSYDNLYQLDDYQYKMIRGIDLYNHVIENISENPNIHFKNEKITKVFCKNSHVEVQTNINEYAAEYCFNSLPDIIKNVNKTSFHLITQHFMGWFIETKEEIFNPDSATFMDFNLNQNNALRFCYVLPYSKRGALVEYTMFSKSILKAGEYQDGLEKYIQKNLGIDEYKILHKEYGKIPMTDYPFPMSDCNRIINIGIPGGMIKPSCGFGFTRLQHQIKSLIYALENKKKHNTKIKLWKKRHHIYNSTFLNVIENDRISKKKVFTRLFEKNNINFMFKFLDENTSFLEEVKFFMTTDKVLFLNAFLKELAIKINNKIKAFIRKNQSIVMS